MADQVDKLRAALLAARAARQPSAPASTAPQTAPASTAPQTAPASTALVPTAPTVVERVPGVGGVNVRITEAGLDQIRRDRANGLNIVTIAKRLGIGRKSLEKFRRDDPRVEEALTIGHAAAEDELVGIVMKKARTAESDRDSLIAAMFLLKARHHYRDNGPLDGAPSTVNVQVNQIDSMTTEQMRRRVAELIAERDRALADGNEETQTQDAEIVDATE